MSDRSIIVRFPPSPTGEVHIGNVRTLLFNYLFARQNHGKVVFRFEDTDKERSQTAFEEPMIRVLHGLGLDWDEGPYRQSERADIYRKYLHQLVEEGKAYLAEDNAQGTGKVVRLKNIEKEIVWQDLVKGEIKINTHTFKDEFGNPDIIIARSIDDAIYHFTVVVDDWLMGVTHVIRGDDHVTSTPRQIMIFEALGADIPTFGHLPTIVGEDRKKLSKRNGTTSLQAFFDLGYSKETMVNYLALLGWNPGDEREFFSMEELIKEFSFGRCQKSPAQFDFKKLDHINKHYMDMLSPEEYLKYVWNFIDSHTRRENTVRDERFFADKELMNRVILTIVRDRINKNSEFIDLINRGELNPYFNFAYSKDLEDFDKDKLRFKSQTDDEVKDILNLVLEKLGACKDLEVGEWSVESLKSCLFDWAGTLGRGQVLHPLRVSLTLKEKSPDPFTVMSLIGKEDSLSRIKYFIDNI
jgi:glutamyl-tRNA synthetase